MASIVHDPFTSDHRDSPSPGANVRLRDCPSCRNTIAADNFECPRCGCSLRWFWLRRMATWAALLGGGAWVLDRYGMIGIF
jgi:uncharacterized paraquat-inducible protein A